MCLLLCFYICDEVVDEICMLSEGEFCVGEIGNGCVLIFY